MSGVPRNHVSECLILFRAAEPKLAMVVPHLQASEGSSLGPAAKRSVQVAAAGKDCIGPETKL